MRIFIFFSLIVLTGCSSLPEKPPVSTDSSATIQDTILSQQEKIRPPAPPPSEVKDSTVLDKWRVYTDVYGTNFSNASNELLIPSEDEDHSSYDGYQHLQLDSLILFNDLGTAKALAIWHTNVYEEEGNLKSCHSCGALMGLALYRKVGEVWRLEKYNPSVDEYGSYGLLPDYKFQQAAPGKFMLVVQSAFTGQGATFGCDYFISLPELETCFSLNTHEDNQGAVDETDPASYSWDALYTWLPQQDSSVVLEVTNQGELPEDMKPGKTRYAWNKKTRKLEEQ